MAYHQGKDEAMKQKKQVPVEVYSRVVGYYRPVTQWNKGKQEEFRHRKPMQHTTDSTDNSESVTASIEARANAQNAER